MIYYLFIVLKELACELRFDNFGKSELAVFHSRHWTLD